MSGPNFKYDLAFSFFQQNEPLAIQLNDRIRDRMKTFLYSEHRKEVAGTDGGGLSGGFFEKRRA